MNTTVWQHTTCYQIFGILRDRAINKARCPKDTPQLWQYNWLTTNAYLEAGACYGAPHAPLGADVDEQLRIVNRMHSDPDFINKRMALVDAVIKSQPYRIGVNVGEVSWDLVQDRGAGSTWYATKQPIPIDQWVSFERLIDGAWRGIPIGQLESELELLPWHKLKAVDPPWRDFYKQFEEVN
jgi:hypothetical protein